MDQTALHLVALAVVKVIGSQLAVGLVACEHVVEGDEHRMADGEHRSTLASARSDATVLCRQGRPLHTADDVGDFSQRPPHPGVAAACSPTEASTTTLRSDCSGGLAV